MLRSDLFAGEAVVETAESEWELMCEVGGVRVCGWHLGGNGDGDGWGETWTRYWGGWG